MKLKVENEAYLAIRQGFAAKARIINDDVSTTRKDPERQEHAYESRYSLVRAMLRKGNRVTIVCQKFRKPIKAMLTFLYDLDVSGLTFLAKIEPMGYSA